MKAWLSDVNPSVFSAVLLVLMALALRLFG
jgi:hypothetical protein